jgi:hypothetical protein
MMLGGGNVSPFKRLCGLARFELSASRPALNMKFGKVTLQIYDG